MSYTHALSHSLPGPDETSPDSHLSLSTTSPTSHPHCTHGYVINDRLFPVSQRGIGDPGAGSDHRECGKRCPVCEGRRDRGGGGQPVRYVRYATFSFLQTKCMHTTQISVLCVHASCILHTVISEQHCMYITLLCLSLSLSLSLNVYMCRVSVPRSSVQAPYQSRRVHRRKSFGPSDSMALNKVYYIYMIAICPRLHVHCTLCTCPDS